MTENEVLECLKSSKRKNDMLGILPGSDIGNAIIKALEDVQQYRAIGTPEECLAALEKLITYENAEKKGLLLRLPCGIGADVYIIPSKVNYELNILSQHPENNQVYHQKVALVTFTEKGWYIECDKDREYGTDRILPEKMYKETWFLSQEEAEAKLKEMEGRAQ